MKSKKITALVMLLALAIACFISATAFPGEHPWDSDGGGSGSAGGPSDGTAPIDSAQVAQKDGTSTGVVPQPVDTWTSLVFQVSFYTVKYLYSDGVSIKRVKVSSRTGSAAR